MQKTYCKNLFFTAIICLFAVGLSAQTGTIDKFEKQKKEQKEKAVQQQTTMVQGTPVVHQVPVTVDSIESLTDEEILLGEFISEDDDPSYDLYKSIWTRERVNPYHMPPDSLPDFVYIDCSEFTMPLNQSRVTSHFGPRKGRMHYGTDLGLHIGDSVRSVFSGRIRIVDYEAKGYGNYIVVRHNNGLETVYGHLSRVLVSENQDVAAGEVIGLGGNTGRSSGPHLHLEMRFVGNAFDTEHLVNYSNGVILTDSLLITKNRMFGYQVQVKRLAAAQASVRYYIVRRGDTLSKIAARNGTSVNVLARLNGISGTTVLREGRRLRIR